MNNYIQIYKNVISDEYCDELIEKFESTPENHRDNDFGQRVYTRQGQTSYKVINLQKCEMMSDITKLTKVYFKYIEQYKKDCDIKPFQFPEKFGVEAFKIKRYLPDTTDEFPAHVDVRDYATARRFLVMFVYLTDNYAGQTELKVLAGTSPCKRGSILLFPPMWPWIHAGKAPVKNPKYIMGSYLQYV